VCKYVCVWGGLRGMEGIFKIVIYIYIYIYIYMIVSKCVLEGNKKKKNIITFSKRRKHSTR